MLWLVWTLAILAFIATCVSFALSVVEDEKRWEKQREDEVAEEQAMLDKEYTVIKDTVERVLDEKLRPSLDRLFGAISSIAEAIEAEDDDLRECFESIDEAKNPNHCWDEDLAYYYWGK